MEISISGPGIVSVNSEELVKTPEAQRQIKAAHGLGKSLRKQVSEIESLRAELAECQQDAERYRWLRHPRMGWDIVRKTDGELLCAEYLDGIELDAAIDAARKGEGE